MLAVYLEARRELLHDRFVAFWERQEETGTWKRLERAVDGYLRRCREARRTAKAAERARRQAEAAERAAAQAEAQAEQARLDRERASQDAEQQAERHEQIQRRTSPATAPPDLGRPRGAGRGQVEQPGREGQGRGQSQGQDELVLSSRAPASAPKSIAATAATLRADPRPFRRRVAIRPPAPSGSWSARSSSDPARRRPRTVAFLGSHRKREQGDHDISGEAIRVNVDDDRDDRGKSDQQHLDSKRAGEVTGVLILEVGSQDGRRRPRRPGTLRVR